MAKIYGYYPLTCNDSFAEQVLFIKTSTIPYAGLGVFAKQALAKGTALGRYSGIGLNQIELDNRYGDTVANYALTVKCKNQQDCGIRGTHTPHMVCIDAKDHVTWASRINDGPYSRKKANVAFSEDGTVFVIKHISVGEELFVDYGEDYWS